jgi:hypothetical protein
MTFESESALKEIEGCCFYESSLTNVHIPSKVDFIGESGLAANALELGKVCDANARFTISEHTHFDEREAIAIHYFGGGERVVVKKDVRVIGRMCFSNKTFGSLNFAPDSELALLEGRSFELCSVQRVIIPISVAVIGRSGFRKASIETLKFER